MPLVDPVTMSGVSGASKDRSSKSALPIELLPTALAGVVTHLYPVLLLTAFYLRFPALVADPVSTLTWALVPAAGNQIAYCVVCLPMYGASIKATKRAQKFKGAAGKKQSESLQIQSKYAHIIFSVLLTILSVPFLLAVQILLGAPLTTHLPHTVLSSAHLALLAIFPLIYVHGLDGAKWSEILSVQSPIDEVFGAAVGAEVGAWLGAVPIPLDWDREWQKWPVTIVTGMYMGYFMGKVAGGWLLRGKRITFD